MVGCGELWTCYEEGGVLTRAPVRPQATEIRFDLVSAVDELAAQLQQEFDFRREAETMDTIRARLRYLMLKCKGLP